MEITLQITIPQRMSGTGSIYSLASEHFDREIRFSPAFEYAVISPAYFYAGNGVTRHRTLTAALREVKNRDLPNTYIIRDTMEMVVPELWEIQEGIVRDSAWEPIPEEWEVTKPQPQKYRFEHGSLFEYQPDMGAYLHVGKGRNRSQAIKAYESTL